MRILTEKKKTYKNAIWTRNPPSIYPFITLSCAVSIVWHHKPQRRWRYYAGATSYHYHCFDYCYDYDSERTSDQDRQQQQQQHISVGMLPHPVALASEGCHNMPCAICYSICWSIYKIKDFTQAPLETFKSQISCPCLHIRCSICTFLGSLAPSPTNSVPQVSSLNFMEILVLSPRAGMRLDAQAAPAPKAKAMIQWEV